jgi:hypothetical protein
MCLKGLAIDHGIYLEFKEPNVSVFWVLMRLALILLQELSSRTTQ